MQTMIFKSQYGTYSKGVSRKLENGTYANAYFPVQFKKGIELENKTKIEIKNSFLTFYTNKDGKNIFYEMILDFETEGKEENTEQNQTENLFDNDLPF